MSIYLRMGVLGPFGGSGHETRPAKSTSEFGTPAIIFLNRGVRSGRRRFRNRSYRTSLVTKRRRKLYDGPYCNSRSRYNTIRTVQCIIHRAAGHILLTLSTVARELIYVGRISTNPCLLYYSAAVHRFMHHHKLVSQSFTLRAHSRLPLFCSWSGRRLLLSRSVSGSLDTATRSATGVSVALS